MSWSASTTKAVKKSEAPAAIDALSVSRFNVEDNAPMDDQIAVAKAAAKEICKVIPGPYVIVSLSGHANGVGWQEKSGYANDYIQVSVTQMMTPPSA